MKKKVLSILLCMAMVVVMMPSMVFADIEGNIDANDTDGDGIYNLNTSQNSDEAHLNTFFTTTHPDCTLLKIESGKTLEFSTAISPENEAKIDAIAKIITAPPTTTVKYYGSLSEAITAINKPAVNGAEVVLLKQYGESEDDPCLYITNPNIKFNNGTYKSNKIDYAVASIDTKDLTLPSSPTELEKRYAYDSTNKVAYFYTLAEALSVANKYGKISTGIGNENQIVPITLLRDTNEDVEIDGYQKVDLDLNGHILDGNIANDGKLNIKDSTFKNGADSTVPKSTFTFGNGKVTGEIVENNDGTLTFTSGKFAPSQQELGEALLYKGDGATVKKSSAALINGEWVVMPNGMSLDFTLHYAVFEKDNNRDIADYKDINKAVKNPDELAAEKDYTAVIYMEAPANDINVRAFDFTALYDDSIMTVNNHVKANLSKYDQVDRSVEGELKYTLSKNNYELDVVDGNPYANPVAAFDFRVNANNVNVDDLFSFDFGKTIDGYSAYVSTMDLINEIPLKFADKYEARITNQFNGVAVVDYIYAPDGYKLAIIAADHGNTFTTTLSEQVLGENVPVYFTSNPAYIAQSTNPEGKDLAGNAGQLKGVYLAFIKQKTSTESAADMKPRVEAALINAEGLDTPIEANMFTGDINNDDFTNYNDASLVYQMLKGNTHWGYDPVNSNTYIGSLKRLICEGNQDGKLYGTIEDVNFILDIITNNGTYSYN